MELHIFDFDGTLFYSPSPDSDLVTELFDADTYGQLNSPVTSKGLGWFQSLVTLSPPVVPEDPSEEWYVQPVMHRFWSLVERKKRAQQMNATNHATAPEPLLFILTGRDSKYQARIEHLLEHAGMLPYVHQVILKPHETAGTVVYKLNTFYNLIVTHAATQVFYYEDREEQGRRLLEGIRQLQFALYPHLRAPLITIMMLPTEVGGSEKQISHKLFFQRDDRVRSREIGQARRWAGMVVKPPGDGGGDASRGTRGPKSNVTNAVQPTSPVAPPAIPAQFHFHMMMVPPELTVRSTKMLSRETLTALVHALRAESETRLANISCDVPLSTSDET